MNLSTLQGTNTLVPIGQVLNKLRGVASVNRPQYDRWIKHYGIQVIQMPTAPGARHQGARYVLASHAEELYQKYPSPVKDSDDSVATDSKATKQALAELHLGALETKHDRLTERIAQLETAVNVQIQAMNLLNDEVRKLLEQLK